MEIKFIRETAVHKSVFLNTKDFFFGKLDVPVHKKAGLCQKKNKKKVEETRPTFTIHHHDLITRRRRSYCLCEEGAE